MTARFAPSRLLPLALSAALTLPLAAAADCITADDLDQGVRVSFANGDITTVRTMGAGIFEVEEIYDEGRAVFRYHSYLSTYNFWWVPLRQGVEIREDAERVDWGTDIMSLPVPADGLPAWTGDVRSYAVDNGLIDSGTREVRYAAGAPITVDGCTYDVVSVGMRTIWDSDDSHQIQIWSYLPDSGLSVIVGWTNSAGEYIETNVTAIDPL